MFETLTNAVRGVLARFTEAAGTTIDNDEEGWRRLTGNSARDLAPMTQTRMQDLGVYLWRSNLLANRLIELPLAFLLAEGVRLTAPDEEAQDWLDTFWHDPVNNMDIKLIKKARELSIYGEQVWPVFVNEINGHVRLGYLDPGLIEKVVTDPDNAEQTIGIITKRNAKGVKRKYRVIVNGPEDVFSDRTRAIRETFTDGECFYFSINDLSNSTRGHSDLLASMDWLDGLETAMFGELERWDFLRSHLWDVTMKGATAEQVNERAKTITAPTPGAVRVHNDGEAWSAVTPDLKSADGNTFARMFRNHIISGSTMPEHWFGGGGDVNRATAAEMDTPTMKVFQMRQNTLGSILKEVGCFVIRMKLRSFYGSDLENTSDPAQYRPTVEWPEMTAKDKTKVAAAFREAAAALVMAINSGIMSRETAIGILCKVTEAFDVEFDVSEELERIEANMEKQRAEDAFGFEPDAKAKDAA
jgi:hypothetical protein